MTHFDKKGAAMHGQNAVTISMGNKTCGMFYGVETESMISHI